PKNPRNPFYKMPPDVNPDGDKYVDPGLGAIVKDRALSGKFKVPTLRNVDRRPSAGFVKAYMHNGYFKSLKEVVHFYNVRDENPKAFPPPEFHPSVNREELGNLGLSEEEEDDVVAFLKTLSDGYFTPETTANSFVVPTNGESPAVSSDNPARLD